MPEVSAVAVFGWRAWTTVQRKDGPVTWTPPTPAPKKPFVIPVA
jgi:hypothetical protein